MIPKLNSCVASEMSNTHLKLYGKEQRGKRGKTKDEVLTSPGVTVNLQLIFILIFQPGKTKKDNF